jgi:phosphoserine aminotransferase
VRPHSKIPVPTMMDWTRQSRAADFFVNTPSMFSVYTSQLVCQHMLNMGGIEYYEALADKKSQILYQFLDESRTSGDEFRFVNKVDPRFRSRMNVPFNFVDKEKEAALL